MSLNLPEIIDSHCHLDFPVIMENIDQIIARAKHRGVVFEEQSNSFFFLSLCEQF